MNGPTGDLSSWETLRDLIFTQYVDCPVIVQTFLAIIKQLGYTVDLLVDRDFFEAVVPKLVDYPEIFSELLMVVVDAMPMCLSSHSNQFILKIIDQHIEKIPLWAISSSKAVIPLLKIYTLTFQPSNQTHISRMIDDIIRLKLRYSIEYPTKDLPELLQVCLQMGYFQEIKDFFSDLHNDWIFRLLNEYSDVVDELIDIAYVVGVGDTFINCIVRWINKAPKEMSQCPSAFIKVLLYFIQDQRDSVQKNAKMWIEHFLREYNYLFDFNMDDSVYLLYLVFKRGLFPGKSMAACIYSLTYFQSLLETSIKGAARLLTLFEKRGRTEKEMILQQMQGSFNPVYFISCCFDKAMSIRALDSEFQLMELLDSIDEEEREKLAGYFNERMPYLRAFSFQLAEKIAEMYQ